MPIEFSASPDVATQLCSLEIILGSFFPNKEWKDLQETASLVSNNQENVLSPAFTLNLGVILSPCVITSNSLMQVTIETAHKLRIICGMTWGVVMRDAMKLCREKLAKIHFILGDLLGINLWPVFVSYCIFTGLIVLFSGSAFLLSVVTLFAVLAELLVSIIIAACSLLKFCWSDQCGPLLLQKKMRCELRFVPLL